eukprot:Gb_02508 [translate_table: standard]
MADTDFPEYNPAPYGGGFDLAEVYGKPKSPSEKTCYPPQSVDYDSASYRDYDYGTETASAYGGDDDKRTDITEEEGQIFEPNHGKPKPNGNSGYQEETREYGGQTKQNEELNERDHQGAEEWNPSDGRHSYPQWEEEPSYNYDMQSYYGYSYDLFNCHRPQEEENGYQPPEDISRKVVEWLFSSTNV